MLLLEAAIPKALEEILGSVCEWLVEIWRHEAIRSKWGYQTNTRNGARE
jgi:hypothetical protein